MGFRRSKWAAGVVARGVLAPCVLALCVGFGFCVSAPAAWSQEAVYQGRLTDENGVPQTGSVAMIELGIYDSEIAGTFLYEELHTNVPLSDEGVFSILLGGGTPTFLTYDASLFTGTMPRYLEVVVNGELLSPRQRIGTVPTALVAEELASDAPLQSRVTDAQTAADAAQGTADTGVTNAATAQTAADAAQGTADTGVTNAATAQGVAGAAQDTADTNAADIAAFHAGGGFEDCGDGTVADRDTGLQWEKKTGTLGSFVVCETAGCPDPHVVNNIYEWSNTIPVPDGGAFTDFLAKLNDQVFGAAATSSDVTGCFAGHCDWRLPNIVELQTILDCGFGPPCIDPIFGPTSGSNYWSASTNAGNPLNVWLANFGNGGVINSGLKTGDLFVRAVRAGSCN